MIFRRPPPEAPVDQGDLIDDCPLLAVASFDTQTPPSIDVEHAIGRVVVLTQTCDLANQKAIQAVVAVVLDAESLVASGRLKSADILGPIRAGRVFGWYFLPKSASHRDSGGGQCEFCSVDDGRSSHAAGAVRAARNRARAPGRWHVLGRTLGLAQTAGHT